MEMTRPFDEVDASTIGFWEMSAEERDARLAVLREKRPVSWQRPAAGMGSLPGLAKILPLVAVGNYLLFFTGTLIDLLRSGARQTGRRQALQRFRDETKVQPEVRTCTLCGVTDQDPAIDFRVCTCAKCGRPTDFCLEHARAH